MSHSNANFRYVSRIPINNLDTYLKLDDSIYLNLDNIIYLRLDVPSERGNHG